MKVLNEKLNEAILTHQILISESLIDDFKLKLKKGLVTAAIVASLLSSQNVSASEKEQIKELAKTENIQTKTTDEPEKKSKSFNDEVNDLQNENNIKSKSNNVIRNMTFYNLTGFVQDCLKELGVDSCAINIQMTDGLIYGKYEAICKQEDQLFIIAFVQSLFYNETLKAIAHELVHVQQYKSGRLKILGKNKTQFDSAVLHTTANSHYYDPQEEEARELGEKLYNKFKKSYLYK